MPDGVAVAAQRPLLRSLVASFFPLERRCAACLTPFVPPSYSASESFEADVSALSRISTSLCPLCRAAAPRRDKGHCTLCGELSASESSVPVPCLVCMKEAPPWETFRFYGVYEGVLRLLILRAKYRADAACARALGGFLFAACCELPPCDVLVPMPRHPSRLRVWGYNPCVEMARLPAELLGIPLRFHFLRRSLAVRPQTLQSRKERRKNLEASFSAHPGVRGRRVLLVDDTMTTGSTLRCAARRLLRAGADAVCAVVVARTALYRSCNSSVQNR